MCWESYDSSIGGLARRDRKTKLSKAEPMETKIERRISKTRLRKGLLLAIACSNTGGQRALLTIQSYYLLARFSGGYIKQNCWLAMGKSLVNAVIPFSLKLNDVVLFQFRNITIRHRRNPELGVRV